MPSGDLPPSQTAPFSGLGPDCVLDALASVGLQGDGRLIQLNSYENRVYQVFLDDGRVVVAKFYRPGRWTDEQILEEHGFVDELAQVELPVAAALPMLPTRDESPAGRCRLIAPTLAEFRTPNGTYRFCVAKRLSGRAPELGDSETLQRMGSAIGRIHLVGRQGKFECRQPLDFATLGLASRDGLLSAQAIPIEALESWRDAANVALAAVEASYARLDALRLLRLHGDCHLGNVLWAQNGPQFVDFDDTGTGPAIQDIWMLLSGDHSSMSLQVADVLAGYRRFMEFDVRELRLIEPLRTLRMLRHSAWIAQRWADPAFPLAFPWFCEPSYWQEQASGLREQVRLMAEPPVALL